LRCSHKEYRKIASVAISQEGERVSYFDSSGDGIVRFDLNQEERKIMERELVVDEYRSSDADKRLALFLHYRDLRGEFALIEERISNGLQPPRYQSWLKRLISDP
jgi:hypothetical protein